LNYPSKEHYGKKQNLFGVPNITEEMELDEKGPYIYSKMIVCAFSKTIWDHLEQHLE